MNLDRLYNIAENEHIQIYDWHIENCNGIYLNYDKINAIVLNYDELGTYIEEKCTLAHELGHYFTGQVYSLNDNKIIKNKAEHKACKWAYSVLVPLKILKQKISKGMNLYELSDYFDVSTKYMIDCINFYIDKYGNLAT